MKALASKEQAAPPTSAVATRTALVPQDIAMIGHVEVSLEANLGTVTVTVEKLFELAAGDVVPMNELLEAPLTLLLNGKPVARGELLAVDDHFGVRILELA